MTPADPTGEPPGFETWVELPSRVHVARREPGAPLVIALHGQGMSERSFARWLQAGIESEPLSWWVPRGILPFETRRSRRIGYAWYVFDGDQEALRASMEPARAYLLRLAEMARRALRPSSIWLLGFSQGAYLASYAALDRPDRFSGLICCCGRPKSEFVRDLERARGLRIALLRGRQDAGMPDEVVARGTEPLRRAGVRFEERFFEAEHRLTPEMARAAARFVVEGGGAGEGGR